MIFTHSISPSKDPSPSPRNNAVVKRSRKIQVQATATPPFNDISLRDEARKPRDLLVLRAVSPGLFGVKLMIHEMNWLVAVGATHTTQELQVG